MLSGRAAKITLMSIYALGVLDVLIQRYKCNTETSLNPHISKMTNQYGTKCATVHSTDTSDNNESREEKLEKYRRGVERN